MLTFWQQGKQGGFHQFPGVVWIIGYPHTQQLIHIRTKSTVGQMGVQQVPIKLTVKGRQGVEF